MPGHGHTGPKLERNSNVPYYVQLQSILKARIHSGELGDRRIPPIRHLAREYGVSVNTALRAYEGLRQEGIVAGAVGRGTFITTAPQALRKENRGKLLEKTIEHALEEALALEFTMEEFIEATQKFVAEKRQMMERVHLVFIECNIEQLGYFTDHLELDPHIHRFPVLLEDLKREDPGTMATIRESNIIVTSFYHMDEVRKRLAHLGRPIVGINLEPEISTIIRIAKIPRERTVGIVTTSDRFRRIIREVLGELGLSFAEQLETSSESRQSIRRLVERCDAILVSPRRRHLVDELAAPGREVIEFMFTPDRTSINNLKVALLELKNGRAEGGRT
jgi:GntR family transcriptional regulator